MPVLELLLQLFYLFRLPVQNLLISKVLLVDRFYLRPPFRLYNFSLLKPSFFLMVQFFYFVLGVIHDYLLTFQCAMHLLVFVIFPNFPFDFGQLCLHFSVFLLNLAQFINGFTFVT